MIPGISIVIFISLPRIPILADVLQELSSYYQFFKVLNPFLVFFPKVKFTEAFVRKIKAAEGKRDQGGISALGVFVESMIWNKLRDEDSLYTVYPNFVWTLFKHMPNIYRWDNRLQ